MIKIEASMEVLFVLGIIISCFYIGYQCYLVFSIKKEHEQPYDENKKNAQNDTLLRGISKNNLQEVQRALSNSADVNIKNKNGIPALITATVNGNKEMVQFLLQHGADVNAKDSNGRSALIEAVKSGNKDIVLCLLKHGADPNAKDKVGKTALMEASARSYKYIVEVLLQHGTDVNEENYPGTTALITNPGKEIAEILIRHGADVNDKNYNDSSMLDEARIKVKAFLQNQSIFKEKNKKIKRKLHRRVRKDLYLFTRIIERGEN